MRRTLKSKALCLGMVVSVVVAFCAVVGCGQSESKGAGGSDQQQDETIASRPAQEGSGQTGNPRAELRTATHRLADRSQACRQMSEAFIRENYQGVGLVGYRKCEDLARKAAPVSIRSMKIVGIENGRGSVIVMDSNGQGARLTFIDIGGKWLLDSVERW